jgi:hypothetical protein
MASSMASNAKQKYPVDGNWELDRIRIAPSFLVQTSLDMWVYLQQENGAHHASSTLSLSVNIANIREICGQNLLVLSKIC